MGDHLRQSRAAIREDRLMRALSVRQPYAYAIVMGYKPVENRDWNTIFRGRILIHAGIKEERDDVDHVLREIADQTGRALSVIIEEYQHHRHGGAIVGAATITAVMTAMDNPWFYGPFGFVMADQKPCPPIRCKGALGFFEVPADVADAARGIFEP